MHFARRFAVMLAAAIAGCATTPTPAADSLIVPGQRVGDVTLGMPLAELLGRKGAPLQTIPIAGTEATTYVFDGMTVSAHDEVYWIVAIAPALRTADGVGPGVEQIAARAVLGRPRCVVTRDGATVYDYDNLYFEVSNVTGKVTQVGVQRQTQTCDGE